MENKNDFDSLGLDDYSMPDLVYNIICFVVFCGLARFLFGILIGDFS